MEIETMYEDEGVVAVNKPAGLVVHGDGRTEENTLAGLLAARYPEMKGVGEPLELSNGTIVDRPGVVHRLDRETSGVIVLAKNKKMFEWLKRQFQSRVVKKTYNSFVYGRLKEGAGTIDLPIGKSRSDFRLWSAEGGARGDLREAVTEYRVLVFGKEACFLEVLPQTGRTHQIRVHLKALHHPVVCDKRYAVKRPCILGFARLALHARTLMLPMPQGASLTLEAPLPRDFKRALEVLSAGGNLAD